MQEGRGEIREEEQKKKSTEKKRAIEDNGNDSEGPDNRYRRKRVDYGLNGDVESPRPSCHNSDQAKPSAEVQQFSENLIRENPPSVQTSLNPNENIPDMNDNALACLILRYCEGLDDAEYAELENSLAKTYGESPKQSA